MAARTELGDCLVVRLQPLREADVIATLLSPDRGRIDAVARGARSSQRRFAGSLRLFCEVTAAIQAGRGSLPILAEAVLRHGFLDEAADYPRLCLASYTAELSLQASQPEHADPALYAWLRAGLQHCQAGPVDGRLIELKLAAEVAFLQVLGLFPDVQACAACGRPTAAGAAWPDPAGGLLCGDDAGGTEPWLPAPMLRVLAVIAARPEAWPEAAHLPVEGRRAAQDRVKRLLAQAIPTPPRSAGPLGELVGREEAGLDR